MIFNNKGLKIYNLLLTDNNGLFSYRFMTLKIISTFLKKFEAS